MDAHFQLDNFHNGGAKPEIGHLKKRLKLNEVHFPLTEFCLICEFNSHTYTRWCLLVDLLFYDSSCINAADHILSQETNNTN